MNKINIILKNCLKIHRRPDFVRVAEGADLGITAIPTRVAGAVPARRQHPVPGGFHPAAGCGGARRDRILR